MVSAVARIEQRFTTLERSATGPDSSRSPRGMDNSNVLTTAAPEGGQMEDRIWRWVGAFYMQLCRELPRKKKI